MKLKRILSTVLAVVMAASISVSVYASENTNRQTSSEQPTKTQTLFTESSEKITLESSVYEEIILKVAEFQELNVKSSENTLIEFSPNQRTNSAISGNVAKINGTLTTDNTIDIHLFSKNSPSTTISKITSSNSKYALILGQVDYSSGEITLTDYAVYANQQFAINIPAGDYAWVVISDDGSYGDSYTLCHNSSLPYGTSSVVSISDDYQSIYTLSGTSLKCNNVAINMSYRYTVDWYTDISTGPAWHKEHIWMEDPYLTDVTHIGGFRYTYGSSTKNYPNAILFEVGTGGSWKHYLDQNPPRVFHDYYDMANKYTPRPLDYEDITTYGKHYIVYDLSAGKVVEFVSGLSREWSKYGDKKNPTAY